jgi:hypothetical protein
MTIELPPVVASLAAPLASPPRPPAPTPTRKPPAKRVARQPPTAAPQLAARRAPAPPVPDSLPAAPAKAAGDGVGLADAQIAGPAGDGVGDGGQSGGECDMARRVQAALRKDPLATAAVRAARAHAIVIWNGDWVQAGAEDGKGLAAVREAITWEVAFAPPACRQQRVRGLVLISLNDGSARLALGAGEWRWSDLLGLR